MFYGLRGFNGGVVFFGIEGYVGGDAEGMRGFFAMFSCNLCFCQRFFFFFGEAVVVFGSSMGI